MSVQSGQFHVVLCYILFDNVACKAWGETCTVLHYVLHSFSPKQTYVSQGEALAPFLCIVRNAAP
eukprot:11900794-Karenia_brevis.AAC.1